MRLDFLTLLRDVRANRLVRQHWTAQQGDLEGAMGIELTARGRVPAQGTAASGKLSPGY